MTAHRGERVDASDVPRVRVIGPAVPEGAYVLHIVVRLATRVSFGRHAGGAPVDVAAGSYVYVGSALGSRGRPLAARLTRHATRVAGERHPIWDEIARSPGLLLDADAPAEPRAKRLRWHVDYLLESPHADLAGVVACRSHEPIEREMARLVESWPRTEPLSHGLGASDDRGHSHLLRLEGGPAAWLDLAREVAVDPRRG